MNLSIISVNYNSLDYLRPCLSSIYQWTRGISLDVIVVDNASPKGDIDCLKEEFPEIKVIKSDRNLGFAGANDLGFKHSTAEWILFLNPDTKLTNSALNVMLDQAQTLPQLGIAGCRLLNGDGSVQTSSIMSFPGILNSFFQFEPLRLRWPALFGLGPLLSKTPAPAAVEAISGACMLVRRDVFEKIGMFSEDYFMYSEDVDLCYQAIRAGLKNYHIGEASMIHYGGTSSVSEKQTAMKTVAELQFCRKNYGAFYTLFFRGAMALNALLRLAVMSLVRWFAVGAPAKSRLASAQTRWVSILKTVCSSGNRSATALTGRVGCSTNA